MSSRRRLMAVLAHPDDESLAVGGTLATLSLASGNGDSGRDDDTFTALRSASPRRHDAIRERAPVWTRAALVIPSGTSLYVDPSS